MDVSSNTPLSSGNPPVSDAVSVQGSLSAGASSGAAAFQEGQLLKGVIENISSELLTARLPDGQIFDIQIASMPDARIGDEVLFRVVYSPEGVSVEILPTDMTELRYNMLKSALASSGLKVNDLNLTIVSALMENHLPLNKESILALNRGIKIAGVENMDKPLFLMNNEVAVNQTNLSNLDTFAGESQQLMNQAQKLLTAVFELPQGALKDQLLDVLLPQNSADPKAAEQPGGGDVLKAQLDRGQELSPLLRASIVGEDAEKTEHAAFNKLVKEHETVLKDALLPQIKEGTLTGDKLQALVQTLPDGPALNKDNNLENERQQVLFLKAFMGTLPQEQSNQIVERLRDIAGNNQQLARKEIGQFALRLKADGNQAQELKAYFDTVSDRLTQLAQTIRDKPEAAQIYQEISATKDSLLFLNDLKGAYMQLPFVLDTQHKEAQNSELFVFADRQSKKRLNMSGSALIALDTANLGHFETYIRKDENQVQLQFRLEYESIQSAVEGSLEKLKQMLDNHGFSLTNYSFRIGEEQFNIGSEEPDMEAVESDVATRFNIDIRT